MVGGSPGLVRFQMPGAGLAGTSGSPPSTPTPPAPGLGAPEITGAP